MKDIKKEITKYYNKNKVFFLGLLSLVFISLILSILKSDTPKETPQTNNKTEKTSNIQSVELSMAGDMLPHDTITNAAKSSEDYNYLDLISKDLQDSFKKADLHFCNQEAVSSASLPVDGYPAFNAPTAFPRDMNKFGCDLISTANNHAADKGLEGIKGTLDVWDKLFPKAVSGMHRSTDEAEKLQVIEENGLKIGFTAFNEVNNNALPSSETGINMLSDTELLEHQIKGLKESSDVVVVSVHWGKEDSHDLTAAQKSYAKKLSDLGADIIMGTGPHVWQPYQVLDRADGGKTYLWNSIGNGLNSQTKQDQLFSAVALINISKDKDGKVTISNPRVLPTYMHYVWGSGVGGSQSQLLSRRDLKWRLLSGSQGEIDKRNDFKTTEAEQKSKLKQYINNDQVQILDTY